MVGAGFKPAPALFSSAGGFTKRSPLPFVGEGWGEGVAPAGERYREGGSSYLFPAIDRIVSARVSVPLRSVYGDSSMWGTVGALSCTYPSAYGTPDDMP